MLRSNARVKEIIQFFSFLFHKANMKRRNKNEKKKKFGKNEKWWISSLKCRSSVCFSCSSLFFHRAQMCVVWFWLQNTYTVSYACLPSWIFWRRKKEQFYLSQDFRFRRYATHSSHIAPPKSPFLFVFNAHCMPIESNLTRNVMSQCSEISGWRVKRQKERVKRRERELELREREGVREWEAHLFTYIRFHQISVQNLMNNASATTEKNYAKKYFTRWVNRIWLSSCAIAKVRLTFARSSHINVTIHSFAEQKNQLKRVGKKWHSMFVIWPFRDNFARAIGFASLHQYSSSAPNRN